MTNQEIDAVFTKFADKIDSLSTAELIKLQAELIPALPTSIDLPEDITALFSQQ